MNPFNFPFPDLQSYLYLLWSITFLLPILETKMFLLLSPRGIFICPHSHLLPSSQGPYPLVKQLLLKQTCPVHIVCKTLN